MKINFSSHFQALSDKFGDQEAIINVERNRRFTFSEFHRLSNKIVNMMRDRFSLGAGDSFLNILNNDNLSLLHYPTIFKGNVLGVMTNYRDSLDEHAWQVECADPKLVFIENELIDSHYELLRAHGAVVICMDPVEKVREGKKRREGLYYFWDLIAEASDENPDIAIDDREHAAVIRFTGGTTDRGKPAVFSLDNWFAVLNSFYALPDKAWLRDTRMLHIAPISHGSGLLVLPCFYAGGCNVTINNADLALYCRTIEEESISNSMMVPTLLYRLLELPAAKQSNLSSLQNMFYGAAPMSPSKLRQLQNKFGNIFIQVYAATEHSAIALSLSKADHLIDNPENEGRLASAGQANPSIEIVIRDDHGRPSARGDVGEICLRSRATILCYKNNPEKTAEEFVDGEWRSGDMAYMDDSGFVFIVDRKKDMIITGGFNVYAIEVEACVDSHEAVLMSAVVGVPHQEWGEAIHAEVVLREGMSLSEEELIDYVKGKLGRFKAPKTVKVVDQLPTSSAGKILRRRIRDHYWKNSDRKVG
jgi:fatty-acyl-CoA synthase